MYKKRLINWKLLPDHLRQLPKIHLVPHSSFSAGSPDMALPDCPDFPPGAVYPSIPRSGPGADHVRTPSESVHEGCHTGEDFSAGPR